MTQIVKEKERKKERKKLSKWNKERKKDTE